MVKKSVVKWEPAVKAELLRQGVPLPAELILAVMWVESRGKAGLQNQKSGASGLMQVMPGTLLDFNKRHGKSYTIEDMRSSSDAAALKQIEVGIGVLSRYWKTAYRYLSKKMEDVPIDLLSRVADLFYAAGPGATQKRLNKLPSITWDAITSEFSNWAGLPHPKNVFENVLEGEPPPYDMDSIGQWLEGEIESITKDPKMGFALGILLLMAAYWLMKGKTQ
jgi:hypothetical protein